MPCLDVSTNVNLNRMDIDSISEELAKTVAAIVGKPPAGVMVVLRGSVEMRFEGNKEAAAFGEIASMDYVGSEWKRQLIAAIGIVLETKLGVPPSRFILKVHNMRPGPTMPTVSKL